MDENKISYYTYCLPSERRLSIVIKNIPTLISEDIILKELQDSKYPVIKIIRLRHIDQEPMPIVAAILEDNDAEREIVNLKHLLHCIVKKVEYRRKFRSAQMSTNRSHKKLLYNYSIMRQMPGTSLNFRLSATYKYSSKMFTLPQKSPSQLTTM